MVGVRVWVDNFITLQHSLGCMVDAPVLELWDKQVSPPLFANALAEWFVSIDLVIEFVDRDYSNVGLGTLTKAWVSWEKISKSLENNEEIETGNWMTEGMGDLHINKKVTVDVVKKNCDNENEPRHSRSARQNSPNLPPISGINETADFALSSACGPVLGHIRALDIIAIPETGEIIAATAGGEDRTDRKISIWDVRNGLLLCQLDNITHKAVVNLIFHPLYPGLLLSSDMEFDVKLWNWKAGLAHVSPDEVQPLLKCWKKHHSRIIYKTAFVPGNDDIINDGITTGTKIGSVHANEPFTSFVFCGSGNSGNVTLIASLSYVIRIYSLRTLSLLHTIQLADIRANKTPITSLNSHPLYDNYILISCDNNLRLFDLSSESTLKNYNAREIASGIRIEGNFSPCGNFVYCGTWDVRSFSSTIKQRHSPKHTERFSPLKDLQSFSQSYVSDPSKSLWESATGVYVWRLHTGKLERAEMRAMEDSALAASSTVFGGMCSNDQAHLKKAPVSVCKWLSFSSKLGGTNKVLVVASLDRTVRTFM
ncbi:hypothetical protein HK096_002665 [Nowakowskiella sp. JEL0078]|nr:hypothetical protein HK096_002665 [Nowakowskiella sp. JEL0078]